MDAIPAEFQCPITEDIMVDPVNLICGHTFDRESIAEWLTKYNTCPFDCSGTVDLVTLHTDLTLRSEIDQYVGNRPLLGRERQQCVHYYRMLFSLWQDSHGYQHERRRMHAPCLFSLFRHVHFLIYALHFHHAYCFIMLSFFLMLTYSSCTLF